MLKKLIRRLFKFLAYGIGFIFLANLCLFLWFEARNKNADEPSLGAIYLFNRILVQIVIDGILGDRLVTDEPKYAPFIGRPICTKKILYLEKRHYPNARIPVVYALSRRPPNASDTSLIKTLPPNSQLSLKEVWKHPSGFDYSYNPYVSINGQKIDDHYVQVHFLLKNEYLEIDGQYQSVTMLDPEYYRFCDED